MAIMNAWLTKSLFPVATVALWLLAPATSAQNIYKCPQTGGGVAYTDRPCADGRGELLHQADDSEVIDRYLRLGQEDLARRYAHARHLDALYEERLAAHQEAQEAAAQRRYDEALAAQQREEAALQQSQLDQAAERDQLQTENDVLRQQNDQYRDALAQPVPEYVPGYWGGVPPPYRRRPHDHDRDPGSHWAPPRTPVYQPCTQLAGGRVQC
jgi:crotonobetainyl-CoA:carnitine CoA-transferase CaiB-like acyl-CoA transferase